MSRKRHAILNTFLRAAEYYGMQEVFDKLFARSKQGNKFHRLYHLIISDANIRLAYRMIKSNKGSKTAGTDGITIKHLEQYTEKEIVTLVQSNVREYSPQSVKRVWIPRPDGKKRPLGIPTMLDRLIQQCIRQILEPIMEAKFHKHSYGFRPLRSAHHALSRSHFLVNAINCYYVVDIDIARFFDEVNHKQLMKQLWNVGIRDLKVRAIVGKILRASIDKGGVPNKGTPQGGVLSPLLANLVLNDLDQWVSSQWETFPTRHMYTHRCYGYRRLKKTKLKCGFIVRYADDAKVFTGFKQEAQRWFYAIEGFINKRLKLEISLEKSKIVNLKRCKSTFLGFEIKAIRKRRTYVARSHIAEKARDRIVEQIKRAIKLVSEKRNRKQAYKLNAIIMGVHNYFQYATCVSTDFHKIAYRLNRYMYQRLQGKFIRAKPFGQVSYTYTSHYSMNYKTWKVDSVWIFPIVDIQMKRLTNFNPEMSLFVPSARSKIHSRLDANMQREVARLMNRISEFRSVEYTDNRLSRYSMAKGRCEISGLPLTAEEVHCHHVIPRSLGGNDQYNNLMIVHKDVHKLIHATDKNKVLKGLSLFKLNQRQLDKLNSLRKKCNLEVIG
ncbi:group II intron reverse transcriptase/maturase [Croceifilum oryzae]|uniref:Group II intron reverse transcriptase/maturase n=1 Tax=Croceifilum oryzae TaxID=1553429 RepID=A0AAJ1WU29_9BACL|nr:group II intron reverse transcriptase/maturase [Croceifilum oryzae]MDQ0417596.1 group II intron reverse transcriptase/maturase [Croceifilum oryzae]